MKKGTLTTTTLIGAFLYGMVASTTAQSINLWRGSETKADWNDAYKWQLKHVPTGKESVHFRQAHSVVAVNGTIQLNNGIMLYGKELSLQGTGLILLESPIPHQSTVNIPASASGQAALTLNDTLSLNARVALAAHEFGTSASKGSVTLKDQSSLRGKLLIGNNGNGSGKIFVHDQSTYHITSLELNTLAKMGGAAEIHILGGSVYVETKANPFETFLKDSSRKIIIGNNGELSIDSAWSITLKKNILVQMIRQKRIVAASGCELQTPIFLHDKILIKATTTTNPRGLEALIVDLSKASETLVATTTPSQPHPANISPIVGAQTSKTKAARLASLLQDVQSDSAAVPTDLFNPNTAETSSEQHVPLAGYLVFFSAALFLLRPAKDEA